VVGQAVGHYQVLEKLGEGGMGEVYKARDTRLNRFVVIKALPPDKVADPERKARFIQEARAASALNHPNIITIYDILTENECDFIVMEYVAGDTLAKKIAGQELRLPQTLKYAAQIADALARAHAAGIVHRDLKPSNIMIAEDGMVKVLDFGLAKLAPTTHGVEDTTATMPKTREGFVVGTTGYMSPEQVRGREIDHRSDIFSFGLVLYEMLCGRRAFQGQSSIEVMTAILKEEPPGLPDTVPSSLRQIVAGCLEKDPAARFESARDLAFALRAFSPGSSISAAVPGVDTAVRASGGRWLVPALAAAVVALAALLVALYLARPEPLDLSAYKFKPFATDAEVEELSSWSPDGKSAAYLKTVDGQPQVMVRSLDAPSPTQLTRLPSGVYGYAAPFFSPDGERVYFIASEALWSVAVVGGEPQEVLKAPMYAAALSPDGKTLAFWQGYDEAGKRYGSVWISSPPGAPPRKYEPAPFRVERDRKSVV
jgi:serine/threonine protein kinase